MLENTGEIAQNRSVNREKLNLFLFFSGKSISLFGSAIYTFAVGLYLLRITGSGITFAINIVLYTLPLVLINPIAGVMADKLDKKIVVVGADLLNGILLLIVYFLAGKIGLTIPLVYFSTFAITVLATFFNIGIEAAKPDLVGRDKLVNINSMDRLIEASSQVMGPMLGGLVFAVIDIRLFILINALSFILAACQEILIDFHYNQLSAEKGGTGREDCRTKLSEDYKDIIPGKDKLRGERKKGFRVEIKEGYQYILSRQHMLAIVSIFTALNFFFGYTVIVPLPYLLNSDWQVDASIYGIIQGGLPVGMIIGALLVKKIMARINYNRLLKGVNLAACLGAVAFGLPVLVSAGIPKQNFILVYYTLLMLLSGVIMSWVDIPKNVLLQQIVPGQILGRVTSVMMSIGKITAPLAYILAGYLLNFCSPLFLFLSGAGIFILFNIWFFASSLGRNFIKVSNINLH